MALTYGFYNAELVNGSYDRTYDAEDFGAMFDGLISMESSSRSRNTLNSKSRLIPERRGSTEHGRYLTRL